MGKRSKRIKKKLLMSSAINMEDKREVYLRIQKIHHMYQNDLNSIYAFIASNKEASIVFEYSNLINRLWGYFKAALAFVKTEEELKMLEEDMLKHFKIKIKAESETRTVES
jgi:hypothetical protein